VIRADAICAACGQRNDAHDNGRACPPPKRTVWLAWSREAVRAHVVAIVAEHLSMARTSITDDLNIVRRRGADPLDMANVIWDAELFFGVSLDSNVSPETVHQVVELFVQRLT
jgi:acyl carrier protein